MPYVHAQQLLTSNPRLFWQLRLFSIVSPPETSSMGQGFFFLFWGQEFCSCFISYCVCPWSLEGHRTHGRNVINEWKGDREGGWQTGGEEPRKRTGRMEETRQTGKKLLWNSETDKSETQLGRKKFSGLWCWLKKTRWKGTHWAWFHLRSIPNSQNSSSDTDISQRTVRSITSDRHNIWRRGPARGDGIAGGTGRTGHMWEHPNPSAGLWVYTSLLCPLLHTGSKTCLQIP